MATSISQQREACAAAAEVTPFSVKDRSHGGPCCTLAFEPDRSAAAGVGQHTSRWASQEQQKVLLEVCKSWQGASKEVFSCFQDVIRAGS